MAKAKKRSPHRKKTLTGKRRKSVRRPLAGATKLEIPGTVESDGSPPPPPFPIVGVGASAGGLEAASQLLKSLPQDLGAALIVIQHLAPKHESLLPELLGSSSRLPVVAVTDALVVEPDHIYVIPPNTQMSIAGGKLWLTPRPEDRSQHKPVDFFFRSLASYAQDRAIAVVLSGTDSDGSAGVREVKGAGGITIAQEPKTAKYDGMPRAAIATGMIDLVLDPEHIAKELVHIANHPYVRPSPVTPTPTPVAEQELARIFQMLRNATGVDFTQYKLPTIKRRLQRRMVVHKLRTVEQYVNFLRKNPQEVRALYQDLLIHVTRFFRDPETFDVLQSKVFPAIIASRKNDEPIRIWVPGCSTGEEAYSIAICLLEFLGDHAMGTPVQIFATDVSEQAVEQARAGTFHENITSDVSRERLERFFTISDGHYRITKSIREMCVFARQDLTRDPPFSRLDLVVCRNVLIYLGPSLQRKLMNVFHFALKNTGFLMLGAAESVGVHTDLFSVADKRHRLYAKKSPLSRAGMDLTSVSRRGEPLQAAKKGAGESRSASNIQTEANRMILTRFSPPGVLVDSNLQIVQFRGQTGAYLEPAPGDASLNLLKMVRDGLMYGLRTALHEARKGDAPARREGLRVKYNGRTAEVSLEVIPITAPGEGRHFLVLFEEARGTQSSARSRPPAAKKPERRTDSDLASLQNELAASREYLQSIIQELEAANEELQSANEEVLSANEELQSTNEELDTAKEELQSTNEELNTVNEELQARNEELSHLNSDLINLLASVEIAIVIVAADLRIRRFTPAAEQVLNLIATDIGRPFTDIKPSFDLPDLHQVIRETINSVTIREREVQDRKGNRFLLRVRPYKNVDNRIDGAVIALFDIEASRRRLEARPEEPAKGA